jgi:hypothetical protein
MSLLAPAFLLGALAVALPVVFHLIRRTTRERTPFSSLMFLRPSPPRLTRRSRLEHLLLLALRAAALVLLALAFARPFRREAAPPPANDAAARRVVLLVDRSASMNRAGLRDAALDRAARRLAAAGPADEVAVLAFGPATTPLVTFDEWRRSPPDARAATARARLAAAPAAWSATPLATALMTAAELVNEAGEGAPGAVRQVVLVTDLQEGSRLEALQAFDWPRGVGLEVDVVRPRAAGNAAVQLVAEAPDAADVTNAFVRVRVVNSPDARREQFEVGWTRPDGAFLGAPQPVYVPPGQSRVVALPVPAGAAAERVGLRGDDEPFDNAAHVLPPPPAPVNVLHLGADVGDDPRQPAFFLRRALPETRRQTVRFTARSAADPLAPAELETAGIVFVTEAPAPATAAALRAAAEDGRTVVAAVASPAFAPALAALLGVPAVPVTEAAPARYALLGELDFRHPLLAPFADPRFSDFSRIHFWRHRRLDLAGVRDVNVVARFDSGDPALVEVAAGRGRVVVLAAGWQPADSQLALSTKFVPLVSALLEHAGVLAPPALTTTLVGDPVPLPAAAGARRVRGPDGAVTELPAGATNFTATLRPGVYAVEGAGPPLRFAVNLDPAESRTAPLPVDELGRFGAPLTPPAEAPAVTAARQTQLAAADAEARQKLWRRLLLAAVLVLVLESLLAGWTARRAAAAAAEPVPA